LENEGPFCSGDAPTLAALRLVPQFGNARRCGVEAACFPRLLAAKAACMALRAFMEAVPGRQPARSRNGGSPFPLPTLHHTAPGAR